MEDMNSLWIYQESIDELKQQLLYKNLELESIKAEADEQMTIHKEYEKQTLRLLDTVIQERDEAKEQLHMLLNKLMATNFTTPCTEFTTTALPQLSPQTPLINTSIPKSSTTESNSFSEPYTYHSQNSSPVNSFFEPVLSPELSNISSHNGELSNRSGLFIQPFVQDYKGLNPNTLVQPLQESKYDQVIDNLVKGRTLPQKGKLLQSVLEAGPLIQTLLVAWPLPRWRNPPPVPNFHVPPLTGQAGYVDNFTPKPNGPSSIHALRPMKSEPYFEMPCGPSQVTSHAVLNFQDVASRSCIGSGRGTMYECANDKISFPAGKRQRFI